MSSRLMSKALVLFTYIFCQAAGHRHRDPMDVALFQECGEI